MSTGLSYEVLLDTGVADGLYEPDMLRVIEATGAVIEGWSHANVQTGRPVSIVDIVVNVEKTGVTVTEVNDALKTASEGELNGFLGFCELPLVSTDFNGSTLSSIVDSGTTYVVDQMVKVLSWYDNESGYSHRMIDLAALVSSTL